MNAHRRGGDQHAAHAIVTGGSSGIGFATAAGLARRGAAVSLIARDPGRLASAADRLRGIGGATVRVRSADVRDQEAVTAAVESLIAASGPCDVLVASAGIARPGRFLELSDDVFRAMIDADYFGTLWSVRAVVPGMVARKNGIVVTISSAAGLVGVYGYSAYGPAKFAVRGLAESLRAELAPHGVHVACVCPPDVDTPQLAEENRCKPRETAAISGTIKPLSADRVAAQIIRGALDRRRFLICPDVRTRLLARFAGLAAPVLRAFMDHQIRSVSD